MKGSQRDSLMDRENAFLGGGPDLGQHMISLGYHQECTPSIMPRATPEQVGLSPQTMVAQTL